MVRVSVPQSTLKWAVDRATDRDAIHRRFPRLDEWLSGAARPTLRQLEGFARATATPFGYLFLQDPPTNKLSIPHYRTATGESVSEPSPDLLETVQVMQRRHEWMREYLIDQGQEPLAFVGSAAPSSRIEDVAATMRDTLGIDSAWARHQPNWSAALRELLKLIEDARIMVVVNGVVGNDTHRVLDVAEFRGFVLVDEYAPLIFVNGADSKGAQMFTLAHELAHIWYGRSAVFDLQLLQPADESIEVASNQLAAEFLIPAAQFRTIWQSIRHNSNRFGLVARQYKVSEIVAARRAQDLNLITSSEFFEFYNNYRTRDRWNTPGGNFYNNQNLRLGRRFLESVVRAINEGVLLRRDAYGLTGLKRRTFEEYARRVSPEAPV